MLLLRVAADIGERQYDDREARRTLLVRFGSEGRGRGASGANLDRIDPHRPRDVLQVLLAEIDKIRIDLAAHVVVSCARDRHAAGLANPLQSRRDIDAVAQNVVALDQNVAEIDADAINDALIFGSAGVALDHQPLNRDRAFDGGDDGGKLKQQAVARGLDDTSPELRHNRPRPLAMFAHHPRRPRLVLAHEARVAGNVGGENRGEAAGGGHCSGTPALRKPARMGSSWAKYVGLSLIAVQAARAREME